MVTVKNIFSTIVIGTMINLFIKEPFVIVHKTGISLDETKHVDFSAFTAKSSPRIPVVFFVACLTLTATSSIKAAISAKIIKKPEVIFAPNLF